MTGLQLIGTGRALPKRCVTNDELSLTVDTSDAWISERTGIRNRYFCGEGESTVTLAVAAARQALEDAGIAPEQIAWVIPHQANRRIISAVAARLTIPDERVYANIDRYGNTSSASIGICLDEMNRAGKLKRGDYILLTAFGGGLTWGAQLICWQ